LIKILVAVMAILLAAGAAGAGTTAYFSDTVNSNTNNFSTGTYTMTIGDNNEGPSAAVTASWQSPSGWAPGQSFTEMITITNTGTISITYLETGFGRPTPGANTSEAEVDALAQKIIVTQWDEWIDGAWYDNITVDPFQNKIKDFDGNQSRLTLYELVRSYKIASEPYADCTGKKTDAWGLCVDNIPDGLSGGGYDASPGPAIPVGQVYKSRMTYKLSTEATNELQGKSLLMDIKLRGIQDTSQRE